MATNYTVTWSNGEESFTATRARKDAAIKFGDALSADYTVTTDSGAVVHEHTEPEVETFAGPDGQQVTVPEDEPTVEEIGTAVGTALADPVVQERLAARAAKNAAANRPTSAPDTDTVTVRKGTKWTDLYVGDKKIAGLSNAHLDSIRAWMTGQ